MKKINIDKRTAFAILSGVFGVGGFIVDLLSMKDDSEEIAQRAAEIVEEKQTAKNPE